MYCQISERTAGVTSISEGGQSSRMLMLIEMVDELEAVADSDIERVTWDDGDSD